MTATDLRRAVSNLPARTVLGLTVYGEARGEPVEGRIAVAWVIKNRASSRRQTIQTVCLARYQFSCWWGNDANALAVRDRAFRVLTGEVIPDAAWLQTLQVAHQVLVGAVGDPTQGATFYCTIDFIEDPSNAATWFGKAVKDKTLLELVRVKNHVFFSDQTLVSRA